MPTIGYNPRLSAESAVVRAAGSSVTTPEAQPILDAIIRRGDSRHRRRAYAGDLATYARWLSQEGLSLQFERCRLGRRTARTGYV